jgi:muconolactone delta-isomerase
VEFLVEFAIKVPEGIPASEVAERERDEATAAGRLQHEGRLVRVWKRPDPTGDTTVLGLYRADSETELTALLSRLPLHDWMKITVTPLERHPNDPEAVEATTHAAKPAARDPLPEPRLTFIYRLEASLGEPVDVGETAQGRRRIVPLTDGTFTGPDITGRLVPGAAADWQIVQPDGTALADLRYTLQTDDGTLLYVRSHGVRHGSPKVLARLARGEQVDASEYTFRTSTQIETAVPGLDWLNKGVFISVGGRQPAGVIYETYLVG